MSKRPKNTPNPTPYASDEELEKIEAKHLHSGEGAYERFRKVAHKVVNVPQSNFDDLKSDSDSSQEKK